MLAGAPLQERVIAHLDLDCFYAQVEMVRLGVARDVPLAVQQWNGLIAVNYAARKFGVSRHDSADVALKKCPHLKAVHVEVIGVDGAAATVRNQGKVSLERYRLASEQIFEVLVGEVGHAHVEKAGLDEAFLDLTAMVEAKLPTEAVDKQAAVHAANDHPRWLCLAPLTPSDLDVRLAVGAAITDRLRKLIFDKLSFTCAVGIACNKMLSKFGSARNKPDAQTIVNAAATPGLMATFPVRSIRMLGGKLGKRIVEELKCETAGQVQAIPLPVLQHKFGEETGLRVYNNVRGMCTSAVTPRSLPKSLNASKSFLPLRSLEELRPWARILADEIFARCATDREKHRRCARRLTVHYRNPRTSTGRFSLQSKTVKHPKQAFLSPGAMLEATMEALMDSADVFPCTVLSLSADNFTGDVRVDGGLAAFFPKAAPGAPPPTASPTALPPPPPRRRPLDSFLTPTPPAAAAEKNEASPPSKPARGASFFERREPREGGAAAAAPPPPADVCCPVCGRGFGGESAVLNLNLHLDGCLLASEKGRGKRPQGALRSFLTGGGKRHRPGRA